MPLQYLVLPMGFGISIIILLLLYMRLLKLGSKISTVDFEEIINLKQKVTGNNNIGIIFIGFFLLFVGIIALKSYLNITNNHEAGEVSTIYVTIIYYIYFLVQLANSIKRMDEINLKYLTGRSVYDEKSKYVGYAGMRYLYEEDYKGYLLKERVIRRRMFFTNIIIFVYLLLLILDTNLGTSIRNLLYGYQIPLYLSIILDFLMLGIFGILFKFQERNLLLLYKNRILFTKEKGCNDSIVSEEAI